MTKKALGFLGFLILVLSGITTIYIVITEGAVVGIHGGTTSNPFVDFILGIAMTGVGIYGIFQYLPWKLRRKEADPSSNAILDVSWWRIAVGVIAGLLIGFAIRYAEAFIPSAYANWILSGATENSGVSMPLNPLDSLPEFYLVTQIFLPLLIVCLCLAFYVHRKVGVLMSMVSSALLTPLLVYLDSLRTTMFIRRQNDFLADSYLEKMMTIVEIHLTGVMLFVVALLVLSALYSLAQRSVKKKKRVSFD